MQRRRSSADDNSTEQTNETPGIPATVEIENWQAEIDALRVREKEYKRAGDAIAPARRRLPMVEVDPTVPLIGRNGVVSLLKARIDALSLALQVKSRTSRPAHVA